MNWISIKDRLPPNDVSILVAECLPYKDKEINDFYFIKICRRYGTKWVNDHEEDPIEFKNSFISHWMPLPDKPNSIVNNS